MRISFQFLKDPKLATEKEAISEKAYFCVICFEAFSEKESLDDHMKTHRELDVNESSCKMEEKPAGVF